MKETALEKRLPTALKEKSQYTLALGVIAVMLWVVGFPVFILFFFGVLAFFILKAFSYESRGETRKIFEFYLAANQILREDDRRWYGFEVHEAITLGEAIVKNMRPSPPLVHFGLGALYQKSGDHSSALKHLAYVVEENSSKESAIAFPSKELREYVRVLRKIERTPAEAPQTSAAVRSLERARKQKGIELLTACRREVFNEESGSIEGTVSDDEANYRYETQLNSSVTEDFSTSNPDTQEAERGITYRFADFAKSKKTKKTKVDTVAGDRKTISEVLHDIYDKNVQ